MTNEILKDKICKILDDKKAVDISVLKVKEMTVIADYFIVCTGRSTTQVKTLSEEVVEKLELEDIKPLRTDGIKEGKWAVIDYGGIIVHIFNDETRFFYCLEKLWSNGSNVEVFKP